MNLSVFYSEKQHVSDPQPGSPSPGKPDKVMASWRERGFPIKIHPPQAATVEDLCLAHDADYVRGVLDCSRANGFGTRSAAVAASLPWTVGSMASAALHALQSGTGKGTGKSAVAVSPTSGFHHAGYAFGGGFCTFNGLIVAARKALQAGAGRVGILDLDQHYGNGTADILAKLELENVVQWTLGHSAVSRGASAVRWLETLPELISGEFEGCGLLLYQAGADCHIDDPLGGRFTSEQMRQRDRVVFQTCKQLGLPVAWNLAGGYQEPIRKVLDLHDQTAEECVRVYGGVGK